MLNVHQTIKMLINHMKLNDYMRHLVRLKRKKMQLMRG